MPRDPINMKMTQSQLEQMLSEIRDEPRTWREEANMAEDFYDGLQLDPETLNKLETRSIPPLIRNLIGSTIDLVLGMEAKNRRDWTVSAEGDVDTEMGLALSSQMKVHERTSGADRACSEAYARQVKCGVGWVEVNRNSDPLGPPYRVLAPDWREIYWDWTSVQPDLSDAQYLVRHRWIDRHVAELYFPGKSSVLSNVGRLMSSWDLLDGGVFDEVSLVDFRAMRETSLQAREWFTSSSNRERVRLSEVWYRQYRRGHILRLPSKMVKRLDPDNPIHKALVKSGRPEIEEAIIPSVRLSWWAGPIQLGDYPSPFSHGRFPYVPFFGMREGRSKVPYGLIRRMISPQTEVNARLSRMMWLLSAKRIIGDGDAVNMPWAEVLRQASRPDALIIMNQNRTNKTADAFRIESDFALSEQQFMVMKDAAEAIQDSAGVYQSMLGKAVPGADSGVAIDSLVQQGSTTLARINSNFGYARTIVGEMLLSMIVDDMGVAETPVSYTFAGERKTFVFNSRDDDGGISNKASALMLRVALQEVPDSPTYRAQQFKYLSEVLKSLPPEMQIATAHILIRAADLPQKEKDELAAIITRVAGGGPVSPEQQAANDQQQQFQQASAQLELLRQQMEVLERKAKAQKLQAEAERTRAGTALDADRLALDQNRHSLDVAGRFLDSEQSAEDRAIRASGANFRSSSSPDRA